MQQLLKPTKKLSRYALMAGVCTLTGLSLFSYYAATVYSHQPQPAYSYEARVLGVVSGKEGYKLRFSATTNGGLIFTGNTFCLSEAADYGSCGTYTTIDTSKKDLEFNPQTAGTTANWKENSASSQVTLPKEADILYAELIWGGNYKYLDVDMTDVLDNEVNLTTPAGNFAVKPDSQTAGEITTNGSYVRTANITEILKKSGTGTYTLASVPGVMVKGNPYNNYAGYTIAIAYKDDTQPARNMSIFVGAEQVGADQFTNTAVVSGFETPPNGTVDGKLFVSAQEGDNMYSGDQMKFGKTKTSLQPLSGPNNKKDNFFASQINGENGDLDQSGSFGDKNQNNSGENATGVRQGWDVTSVDISNQLSNGQKEAYAQGTSTGDSYVINALGMQIEVNSAKPTLNASVVGGKNEVCEGQEATLEIVVKNEGSADSKNTKLYNLVPQGTELKADSILIDGKPSSATTSVDLGLLKPGESKTVRYTVVVNKNQNGTALTHKANVDFSYDMTSQNTLNDTISSNEIKLVMGAYCGINRPPIAEDDSEKTKKATPITISALTNDSDPDNSLSELKITNVATPSHGKAELKSDGSIVYTPDADFTGKDTFEYTLCDPSGLCDKATVTVIVQGKKPPLANPDQAKTKKNTPVTVDVLPNDSSEDSTLNPQTLEVVTQPKNGAVQVVNGKVVYTPKNDFTGNDQLTYKVCDMQGECVQAIATFLVTGDVDEQPNPTDPTKPTDPVEPDEPKDNTPIASPKVVAVDDAGETKKNASITLPILKNDTIEKVTSVEIVTQPKNGTVEILPDNTVKYTPKADYVGNDIFVYNACNAIECDIATVQVMVKPDGIVLGDVEISPALVRSGGMATGIVSVLALAGIAAVFVLSERSPARKQ